MPREQRRRLLVGGIVIAALVALLAVFLLSRDTYYIRAQFPNAGQLVNGNVVQIAGRKAGSVADIRLTDSNEAEIKLKITDGEFKPLHEGTTGLVRAVGLSGIANRYVELRPGPLSAPKIPDGGVLKQTETRPYVELDSVLNALGPKTRGQLQSLIRNGADIYGANTGEANRAFRFANPAFSQLRALGDEIASDEVAVDRLVTGSAAVVSALASRRGDLDQGVASTAKTLRAIAGQEAAFEDALGRTPDVIARADRTMTKLRAALGDVRPTLRAAQPGARPLARVIRQLAPVARDARPVIADLRSLLPALRRGLLKLPALTSAALPALDSAVTTVRGFQPITEGLRPYAPDLIAGLGGFGGHTSGYYDANGHFLRIGALAGQDTLAGLTSTVPPLNLGDFVGYRTGLTARCPGGATGPARDSSNPWVPEPSLCNPEHNHR